MKESWTSIIERYRGTLAKNVGNDAFCQMLTGIAAVAEHIERTQLRAGLFGWTSMHDLCIQQTDVQPGSGPFLRISPLRSGNVEFRYIDTQIAEQQWHREVVPDDTVRRFEKFLEQLRWIGGTAST